MKYYVDIDNTICVTQGTDYENAVPIPIRIAYVNSLLDEGHHVTYWTARGVGNRKDWMIFTVAQLEKWGARYSCLSFVKPVFDKLIDDRSIWPFEKDGVPAS